MSSFFYPFFAGLFLLAFSNSAIAEDSKKIFDWNAVGLSNEEWLRKVDHWGPKYSRPTSKRFWKSRYGLQVEESCFRGKAVTSSVRESEVEVEYCNGKEKKKITEQTRSGHDEFDRLLDSLVGDLRRCGRMYPELVEPYFRKLVSKMRRGVLECKKKKNWWHFFSNEGSDAWTEPDPKWNTIYVWDETTKNTFYLKAALFHELLHNADVDNNGVTIHNDVYGKSERLAVEENYCLPDRTHDRVYAVADLCIYGAWSGITPSVFYKKFNQCGAKHCERLFTSKNEVTKGLDEDSARRICTRIRQFGHCDATVTNRDYRIGFVKSRRDWKTLSDKIRRKLLEVSPHFENEIPEFVTEIDEQVKRKWADVKDDTCFSAMFAKTDRGFRLNVPGVPKEALDPLYKFAGGYSPMDHLLTLKTGFESNVHQWQVEKACNQERFVKKVREFFAVARETLMGDSKYPELRNSIWAFGSTHSKEVPSIIAWVEGYGVAANSYWKPCQGPLLTMWRKALGDNLVEEMISFSKRADPISKDLSCEDLGFLPSLSFERWSQAGSLFKLVDPSHERCSIQQ